MAYANNYRIKQLGGARGSKIRACKWSHSLFDPRVIVSISDR